ncbi:AMP-binding protein [Solicola sp. PLA-1-18]|uniref:AMP-binding protein n=1 Tax=Solicola sp. PLA-1-18 TaxID=3380532 RepID=UPI003B78E8F8
MSIGRAVSLQAARDPDAVAVRCGDDVLTRVELDRWSNRLARAWGREGVGQDDLVTVSLPNGVDVVVACVAVWKLGATPQPLSPRTDADERRAVLDLARPALVVDETVPTCDDEDDGLLPDRAATSWKAPTSSGSTGRPKIVLAAAPATVDPDGPIAAFVPHEAVQLVAGPLTHAAPFVYAMRGLTAGHELVVMPRFDAAEWLDLVQRHRVTWGLLAPATMHRVWRLGPEVRDAHDVSSLEAVLHLGAPCAAWLKRAWIDWLGPERVVEVYAGTESQGLTTIRGDEWLAHPGSVGRAVGGSRFRVVRPDGTACDPGESGEVLMRRDHGTYAYLGAEPVVRDGWHTLGDAGHLDADGYLYLADRLADVLVVGGTPVSPAEVEAVLEEHPAVRSAVVTSREDRDGRLTLHAVVDAPGARPTEADLDAWTRPRLGDAQRPRSYAWVDDVLRDDGGKVRRSAWRS